MSDKYKIGSKDKAYFVTMTVVGWLDVFAWNNHKLQIVESIKYCQDNKGLTLFAWCLMPNHLHMIVRADGVPTLSDILRDFKKFTAKAIIKQIKENPESHKKYMISYFEDTGKPLKRIKKYKFWQDGNQAKEITNNKMFYQKLEYIHNNPVRKFIVSKPEDYIYSSARNYAELDSLLEIVIETSQLITYS